MATVVNLLERVVNQENGASQSESMKRESLIQGKATILLICMTKMYRCYLSPFGTA